MGGSQVVKGNTAPWRSLTYFTTGECGDNRSYAKSFSESLAAPPTGQTPDDKASSKIEF